MAPGEDEAWSAALISFDVAPDVEMDTTTPELLDDLPEHRVERCHVLLKNLPSEDLVHIVPEKIPAFLRIDRDVKNKRELLYDFYRQYQEFDIEYLEKDVKKRLV